MKQHSLSFIPALNEQEYHSLLKRYSNSRVMKQYLHSLYKSGGSRKNSITEIVTSIYGPGSSDNYKKYINRFYKLRKKLADDYYAYRTSLPAIRYCTEEEEKREVCRKLIAEAKFTEAERQLGVLQNICETRNIFELLPDVIEMRIYVCQSLNNLHKTAELFKIHTEAVSLLADLSTVKRLARQIYESNQARGILAAKVHFQQIDRICRKNPAKPRFKLIYNFLSVYYKAGEGGDRPMVPNNIIARHLSVVKNMFILNPAMPVLNYTPGYSAIQKKRFQELRSMLEYKLFHFKEAATIMDDLLEETQNAQALSTDVLTETLILNTIHLHIAAANSKRAVASVRTYISFLRKNNSLQRLPKAYCEMANVYTTLGINATAPELLKMMKSVKEYENSPQRTDDIGSIWLLKTKLLWMLGSYNEAIQLFSSPQVKEHFANEELWKLVLEIFKCRNARNAKPQIILNLFKKVKNLKYKTEIPSERSVYNWIDTLAYTHI